MSSVLTKAQDLDCPVKPGNDKEIRVYPGAPAGTTTTGCAGLPTMVVMR